MLVLTRRPGESVKIGDDITVTVLGVRGNQLRLGFEAPEHIAIHREEVYLRKQAEKVINISEATTGNSALRPFERFAPVSKPLGLSQRNGRRRPIKLSFQTRKELLKW